MNWLARYIPTVPVAQNEGFPDSNTSYLDSEFIDGSIMLVLYTNSKVVEVMSIDLDENKAIENGLEAAKKHIKKTRGNTADFIMDGADIYRGIQRKSFSSVIDARVSERLSLIMDLDGELDYNSKNILEALLRLKSLGYTIKGGKDFAEDVERILDRYGEFENIRRGLLILNRKREIDNMSLN